MHTINQNGSFRYLDWTVWKGEYFHNTILMPFYLCSKIICPFGNYGWYTPTLLLGKNVDWNKLHLYVHFIYRFYKATNSYNMYNYSSNFQTTIIETINDLISVGVRAQMVCNASFFSHLFMFQTLLMRLIWQHNVIKI